MSRKWIKDLKENDHVDERYLVWRKTMPVTRNGRAYLNLQLGDRTGRVETRVWERAEELNETFELHDVIDVEGRAIRYQDHIQINVTAIRRVPQEEVDLSVFLPASERPLDELWSDLAETVDSVENPPLRKLLDDTLKDPDVAERLRKSPAAKSLHHARVGGLLEHVLSLCGLADVVSAHYRKALPEPLDRDLLIAGAILHDLGKIWELESRASFEYTDRGRLLGHVAMTYEYVSRRIAENPEFPEPLAMHLQHIILSHHGELEYGSPKRPKTTEAWVLHFLDIMDGHLTWLQEQIRNLKPGTWTPYQKLHDRYFWKPARPGDPEAKNPGRANPGTGLEAARRALLKVSLAERVASGMKKPEDPDEQ